MIITENHQNRLDRFNSNYKNTMKICKKCGQEILEGEKEIDRMHEMCFLMVDEKAEREDRI